MEKEQSIMDVSVIGVLEDQDILLDVAALARNWAPDDPYAMTEHFDVDLSILGRGGVLRDLLTGGAYVHLYYIFVLVQFILLSDLFCAAMHRHPACTMVLSAAVPEPQSLAKKLEATGAVKVVIVDETRWPGTVTGPFAARRAREDRPLPIAGGLALVAGSMAKLFLFDLGTLSGMFRVAVFIVVGLVLLAMGFSLLADGLGDKSGARG